MFRQLSRRLKSEFVLAQRAADGSLQMADISVINRDLTWSTSYFAQVELNGSTALAKVEGIAKLESENLTGKIVSMSANPGGKSAPHGFLKGLEETKYYFQPKKCPIGLEDAIMAHEEELEVSFDLCQMGKTGLRAMNVRIEK
ncbi:unnamed protein product [Oikopleura dioica]|uniref:Uncharacterized protein n=1 Tax=Oikopleura dioica TaxID=34765 RepID=E4X822_OIKDI|nr:unnamed protein product [Oikopleura dioica]